ncbi:alpha-D-ribose 1-methylphosphonate 5-phosphate C-P-lyase PhnJ [Paenibacillus sp. GCM10027630]|uniref:alpha-D-ribose 1-methylphosphonate 5-phosphate C-P-lyase PhnJ n=1 Tax=Paenibacillus sp. GCM10027630 TaxID=3273415 RepID=UPI003639D8F3
MRETAGVLTTEETEEATLIQCRHCVPEEPLREDQILVLQVPLGLSLPPRVNDAYITDCQ